MLQRSAPRATQASPQGFDAPAWLSLEGCALRGDFGKARIQAVAGGVPCMGVANGIGAQRAPLPLAIDRQGELLHLDFIYRDTASSIDAHKTP